MVADPLVLGGSPLRIPIGERPLPGDVGLSSRMPVRIAATSVPRWQQAFAGHGVGIDLEAVAFAGAPLGDQTHVLGCCSGSLVGCGSARCWPGMRRYGVGHLFSADACGAMAPATCPARARRLPTVVRASTRVPRSRSEGFTRTGDPPRTYDGHRGTRLDRAASMRAGESRRATAVKPYESSHD